MANAAAKKAAKAGAAASSKVGYPLAGSVLLFLFYRCFWNYSSLGLMHILGYLVQIALLIVSYFGIIEAAKNPGTTELYYDLYYVTLFSQVVSCFTDWGWYILVVVPIYGAYLGYGLWKSNPMGSLLGSKQDDDEAELESTQSSKKHEKRKVKYARR